MTVSHILRTGYYAADAKVDDASAERYQEEDHHLEAKCQPEPEISQLRMR
jgi:hypothetical protein